jgi:imidazolonepropionase-like amidohydrolase
MDRPTTHRATPVPAFARAFAPGSAPAFALALALALAACGNPAPDQTAADPAVVPRDGTVAFVAARIFDGTGEPPVEDGIVVVRDGVIRQVGPAGTVAVPDDLQVVDLEGRFLMPGFINAHGHVAASGDRSDIREQLEIYSDYGITTVLSLGDAADDPREERWSADLQRARLFVSGPSLNPSSPDEAAREVERVADRGADWVKMHVNQARGRDTYPAVIAAARERDLPVAIHIEELKDARGVLDAGADLIAHSVRDLPVDDALIAGMLERDVCLVPTFTRELSTFVYAERPDFFDDPFFLERAAPDDLDAFITPQRQQQARSPGAQYWREQLPLAMENMRRLHEAGVGIAMGTDSGPSGRFQGYFEHLEMEMMVEAGMTPEAVLIAATRDAARCIGLEGMVGTIAPGAWADLVVLEADPRQDIRNTREIHSVWTAGNRVR